MATTRGPSRRGSQERGIAGKCDGGDSQAQRWETSVRLAETGRLRQASFVILSPAEKLRHVAVLATFGRPAGSHGVGPCTILVWPGDLAPKVTPQGGPPAAKTVSVTRPGG